MLKNNNISKIKQTLKFLNSNKRKKLTVNNYDYSSDNSSTEGQLHAKLRSP